MAVMWYLSVLFFAGLLASVSCNPLKEVEHNAAKEAEKDIERRDVSSGKLYVHLLMAASNSFSRFLYHCPLHYGIYFGFWWCSNSSKCTSN